MANRDFQEKLKRRGFNQKLDVIELCRAAYEGGAEIINTKHLFSHTREVQEEYIDRWKRAFYLNYTAPIVNTYSYFLFKSPIVRDYDDKNIKLSYFFENCDRLGTSLTEFMGNVDSELLTVGSAWIVVDYPDIKVRTKAEELEHNITPYLYTIKTEDILDFAKDSSGYKWVKYKVHFDNEENIWDYDIEKQITEGIAIYSRGKYEVYTEDGELIQERTKVLSYDFVPIVHLELTKAKPFISDIARTNRSLLNWCSLLDEILYRQTFSWLIVPSTSTDSLASKKIGTSWAWTYDADSKHKPSFISPDSSQASTLEARCEKAIKEIYRMSNLSADPSADSNKSGVAKSYDFIAVNKTLTSLSSILEKAEKNIISFIARFNGESVDPYDTNIKGQFDVTIQYPTDFSISALQDTLERYYEALNTNFSLKFKKLVAENIVSTIFPTLNSKDVKLIHEEIDSSLKELPDPIDDSDNSLYGQETQDEE